MKTMTLPDHYTCKQCPNDKTIFQDYQLYTEHLCKVHNDYRHVCKFCAKLFKLKGSLLVHQRVMHQPINARVTNLLAKRKEEIASERDPNQNMNIKTEVGEIALGRTSEPVGSDTFLQSEFFENLPTQLKQEHPETGQGHQDLEKGEIKVDDSKGKSSSVSPASGGLQCNACNKGCHNRPIISILDRIVFNVKD